MTHIRTLALACLALVAFSCGGPTTYHNVSDGDRVRFVDGRSAPPAEWVMPDFDDSSWRSGPSPVGIGKRVATRVDGLGKDFVTVYVRVPFDLGPTAASVTRLFVTTPVLGGGYVMYVNGREVAREGIDRNAPAGAPSTAAATDRELTVDLPAGTLRPTDNVVAVEARCPPSATDVAIGFTLDADEPEPTGILRGPYVQMVSTDGATIVFDTAEAVHGAVVVDGRRFEGRKAATHHEIAVSGLAPASAFSYHVEAGAARSEDLELTTAPTRGEPVTFLVYGDTRTNGDVHRRLVRAMATEGADMAINTGDLVATGGNESEWETFFDIEYPLLTRTALFPALGNHETNGGGTDDFEDVFVLPRNSGSPAPERLYSFDVGDVHFVAIDSNMTLSAQADWIDADCAAARAAGAKHIFFYIHHGPYSAGAKHGGSAGARQVIVPLMRRHDVDAIFGGHDHIYERGLADDVRYFVSGGGGAPLHGIDRLGTTQVAESKAHYLVVTAAGGAVRIEAKDIDGTVFDSVEW
jgi:hypothetical protein